MRGITWTHKQSVWNHSGPSEVPYSSKPVTKADLELETSSLKVLSSANVKLVDTFQEQRLLFQTDSPLTSIPIFPKINIRLEYFVD